MVSSQEGQDELEGTGDDGWEEEEIGFTPYGTPFGTPMKNHSGEDPPSAHGHSHKLHLPELLDEAVKKKLFHGAS